MVGKLRCKNAGIKCLSQRDVQRQMFYAAMNLSIFTGLEND